MFWRDASGSHRLSLPRGSHTLRSTLEAGWPMPTWILRKNVDDERLGRPRSCSGPHEIQRVLGVLTVEEQIASMLARDETVDAEPDSEASRKIYRGVDVVGYIVMLSNDP